MSRRASREKLAELVAVVENELPADEFAWQRLIGSYGLLRDGVREAVRDAEAAETAALLERVWHGLNTPAAERQLRRFAASEWRTPSGRSRVDEQRLSRHARALVAGAQAALAAGQAGSHADAGARLMRWALETARLLDRAVGGEAVPAPPWTTAPLPPHRRVESAFAALAEHQVPAAAAQYWTLHLLQAVPRPQHTLPQVPVAFYDPQRKQGFMAALRFHWFDDGQTACFEAPESAFLALGSDLLAAVEEAASLARQASERTGSVCWGLEFTDRLRYKDVHTLSLEGPSLQGAALVGIRLLLEERRYDPSCLMAFQTPRGEFRPVDYLQEKLRCAREQEIRRVVLAPNDPLPPAERAALTPLQIYEAGDLQTAGDLASDQAHSDVAHVLYMDLVGYSLLPMEDQPRLLAELQQLVRSTREFQQAKTPRDLIRLPTGDGMALVFFRDPAAPVQCAMQISQTLRRHPQLRLRMGVHSGPIYRVEDINAGTNVSGPGINVAQRVMACGDAGHILLSLASRELSAQMGSWPVHDLGLCEVKHGEQVHLFNLYADEIGNPAPPPAVAKPRPDPPPHVGSVVLLYKRNAQPDDRLLRSLEGRFKTRGVRVFVDQHLKVGVEWAQEIERQIRSADAVIPLLSARSIDSEMLQWELQIAYEAAREQQGKPRLLPVRLNDLSAEELVPIVGRLQHATWKGPEDDAGVFDELMGALQRPPKAPAALPPPGGAMPLDSEYYVVRPTDHQFHAAVERRESIVLVKGARQMGKTSLLARGLQQARESGFRDVHTDLQSLDPADFESPEALFKALATSLAERLELDTLPHQVWHAGLGSSMNFARYMRREILRNVQTHLVWAIDESDRLLACDFGSQVFGLFRTWHNDRALDPTGPWARLTLVIAYATEAHLFIKDVDQSPFNVGLRLSLQDFTLDQLRDLNDRYGSPLRSSSEVERFHRLVGGHPYLVTRGFREMVDQGLPISTLEAEGDRNDGLFGDHLRRMLVVLARNPALCEVVRGVLRGQACPTEESFYRLCSAGIMVGESVHDLRPRCQLYATYLKRHLP